MIFSFSSPIGAFIFLIGVIHASMMSQLESVTVFVPYRGFYFLNMDICTMIVETMKLYLFSSPIGAFIFLIENE